MNRIFNAFVPLVLVLWVSVPTHAQQSGADAKPADDWIVARVNDSEILQSDVALAYSRLPERFHQVPINVIYPQIVQQLVDGELLFVAGRDDELQKDPEVLKQMDEFEKVAIQQVYMRRLIAKGISVVELQRIYDETIRKTEGPLEVRASHILVEDEQDATDIIKALNRGADFDKLARERSIGPSAPRGGDLGYFVRSAMVQPFADAAFALRPGTMVPGPVKSELGWHVIKVVDKRRQPAPSFEESRGQIEQQLTRDLIAAHMAELRAYAKIELFNIDGSPVADTPKK